MYKTLCELICSAKYLALQTVFTFARTRAPFNYLPLHALLERRTEIPREEFKLHSRTEKLHQLNPQAEQNGNIEITVSCWEGCMYPNT